MALYGEVRGCLQPWMGRKAEVIVGTEERALSSPNPRPRGAEAFDGLQPSKEAGSAKYLDVVFKKVHGGMIEVGLTPAASPRRAPQRALRTQ
jgi:hypothetical protein